MNDKATILLVDDTRTNIELLAGCLQKHYNLKVAMDGKRCIELAERDPIPDLILLDVIMPDMDGYEVCRTLKSNPSTKDIPIIFVTGKDSDKDEEFGLQLGAVDYITKPIRPAIVTARVGTQIILKQQSDALRSMALHDQLTRLFNRHYLIEAANSKVARITRHGGTLSVMMIDIDYFKLVNDQFGHQGGDTVLKAVANVLSSANRKEDIVARFGGEEFVILLDHCSISDADEKAEQLRSSIEHLLPEGISVTASFGIAELQPDGEEFEHLLARADQAVYLAKEKGRNCVVQAEKELEVKES
ncbi:diguanylate cyclase [Shewanella nanhaiensis]|uniref:diguanylate cyclase n=1 Tax=Shewanella nanhaiensis TaxID=2864872 RepID=A0ABS7E3M5_9GAMM|nr:diguanylate cyclase [Shewanella nanhaiensis]MBW8184247.1 diguanylate cyclase [Shewanella nanhaiensis]